MKVSEAVASRYSARAFLTTPVNSLPNLYRIPYAWSMHLKLRSDGRIYEAHTETETEGEKQRWQLMNVRYAV